MNSKVHWGKEVLLLRRELWKVFSAFFRIGLFTFGGGYAMLPLMEKEIVDKHNWVEQQEMLDIYALAQSLPGAIAVNTAIFVGRRLYGIPGALAALLGMVTPSLAIIIIIARFFVQFKSNVYVGRIFNGIRAGVIGLIAAAAVRISKNAIKDKFGLILAGAAFILSISGFIHVIFIILAGGLAGYLFYRQKGFDEK